VDACYRSVNLKTPCNSVSKPAHYKPLVAGASPAAASFFIKGRESEGLASGAEAGATVLHRDPLGSAAADGAGLASPMSDLRIRAGCA
jgi:hypothetical protein